MNKKIMGIMLLTASFSLFGLNETTQEETIKAARILMELKRSQCSKCGKSFKSTFEKIKHSQRLLPCDQF